MGDARKGSALDPQPHTRVRPDIPYPTADRAGTRHRDVRRYQLDQVGAVAAANHADTLAAPLSSLSPRRADHPISGRGREQDCWEHQGAQNLPIACTTE